MILMKIKKNSFLPICNGQWIFAQAFLWLWNVFTIAQRFCNLVTSYLLGFVKSDGYQDKKGHPVYGELFKILRMILELHKLLKIDKRSNGTEHVNTELLFLGYSSLEL